MRTFLSLFVWFFSTQLQAQILGKVEAASSCTSPSEVFVAQGKKLLFQIHVPVGGTFEVKLNPGKYVLTALNEDECMASTALELKKDQINMTLAMSPLSESKRKPNFYSEMASQRSYLPVMGGGMGFPWWSPWSMYMYPSS
jgi:hypothetical protein